MEMFLFPCFTVVFRCIETVVCHAYNSTVLFRSFALFRPYGRVQRHPYIESVEKNWKEREVRGGKGEDTSNENLPSTGDGERGY